MNTEQQQTKRQTNINVAHLLGYSTDDYGEGPEGSIWVKTGDMLGGHNVRKNICVFTLPAITLAVVTGPLKRLGFSIAPSLNGKWCVIHWGDCYFDDYSKLFDTYEEAIGVAVNAVCRNMPIGEHKEGCQEGDKR